MMLLVDFPYFFQLITKEENIIVKEANLLQAKYSDGISPEFPIWKIVLFEERWKI